MKDGPFDWYFDCFGGPRRTRWQRFKAWWLRHCVTDLTPPIEISPEVRAALLHGMGSMFNPPKAVREAAERFWNGEDRPVIGQMSRRAFDALPWPEPEFVPGVRVGATLTVPPRQLPQRFVIHTYPPILEPPAVKLGGEDAPGAPIASRLDV